MAARARPFVPCATWNKISAMSEKSGLPLQAGARAALMALRLTPERVVRGAAAWLLRGVRHAEGRRFLTEIVLLARRDLSRGSPATRAAVLNFIANFLVKGEIRRARFREATGVAPPVFFVISPTMRCNLHCYGCYAGKYAVGPGLGLDVVERLVREAEEMGVFFLTISGGEPFVMGDEFIEMMARHRGIAFQIYTNGTLITRRVAERLAATGNAYPCISVEGFEEHTDQRRGTGTFARILQAMAELRKAGVVFGFSATATRENNDLIVSRPFVDFYKQQGCRLGWYFHYVPVGREPGMSLMPTPEQRLFRRTELAKRRQEGGILLADFWNDGPLVGGCLAGGRSYLHVSANGDIEPCVFAHFAVDNIATTTIAEALRSPFMSEIRRRQPYDKNLLRPCMIIDWPHVLREVVEATGARPSHPGAEAVITSLAPELDAYARAYGALADRVWESDYMPCRQPEGESHSTE